ncbi:MULTISPECIES: hypothetical protein [unclassified Streptomyces]|uniref:hypothetical protein n=1 Tax=unclassified Streptomyces TaxID=2593676 RepID=UPI0004C771BC|nr:hypothetical protein [Streptomyces sp. NRRL F-2747]
MSVYIGELHTDVVPAAGGAAPAAAGPDRAGGRWAAAEHHREACERAAWLADRVAAEGFDD